MKIKRPLLLPLSPIYWLITSIRNLLFNIGILRSRSYDLPIIGVGNLSVGGTGKTPHTEYVARILKDKMQVAILSRGYGRISSGIQVADVNSLPLIVGDEPAQLKKRLPEVYVVADSNRVRGVNTLLKWKRKPQVVILDDAYQHRWIQANYYVLLTAFDSLYCDDVLLPAGNLRESRVGANRANSIIVTKCPESLSNSQKEAIIQKLRPKKYQTIHFTTIKYGKPFSENEKFDFNKAFVLVTGIANDRPLLEYLDSLGKKYHHLRFKDHHEFSDDEVDEIIKSSHEFNAQVVTTEKDYQRFSLNPFRDNEVALAYLPISIGFQGGSEEFDNDILKFVGSFSTTQTET